VHNTIWHDVGSAIVLQPGLSDVGIYNNVIVINSGFGLDWQGLPTNLASNYNNVYPSRVGANVGRYQGQVAADLVAWRALSSRDANSLSANPRFLDINGSDNLLGWVNPEPQNPQSRPMDFGQDDNFHLRAGSPSIDAADSINGLPRDQDGSVRVDDSGTLNRGNGRFPYYDIGAFEFRGSSGDVQPPAVVGLSPVGMVDNGLSNARFTTLTVRFSEPMDATSVRSLPLYSLIDAGPDGLLQSPDDNVIRFALADYTIGELEVRLVLPSQLPQGIYRLTGLAITSGQQWKSLAIGIPPALITEACRVAV
jgi:hypothetical protein